jgi:hypothetical protein
MSTRRVTGEFLGIVLTPSIKEQTMRPGFFFDVAAANGSAAVPASNAGVTGKIVFSDFIAAHTI